MRVFEDYALPGFWQDPFAVFAPQFASGDRIQAAPGGGLAVLGREALDAFGRHPAVDGTPMPPAVAGEADPLSDLLREGLFTQVKPRHRGLRKAAVASLNRRSILDFAPSAVRLLQRRVENLGSAPVDLFEQLASPFAAETWSAFIGYAPEKAPLLVAEVERLASQFSFTPDPAMAAEAAEAAAAVLARTRRLLESGRDCVASRMARALQPSDRECAAGLIASMLFDAVDTTAAALAGAIAILSREMDGEPLSDETVREDAIEEAFRLTSPATMTVRQARETFSHDGLIVAEGAMIWMWWAAGNCDPAVFPDPSRFTLGRPRRGLPFGTGPHGCIGHGWSKMLAHVVVRSCLAGPRRLRPASQTIQWTGGGARRPSGHLMRLE